MTRTTGVSDKEKALKIMGSTVKVVAPKLVMAHLKGKEGLVVGVPDVKNRVVQIGEGCRVYLSCDEIEFVRHDGIAAEVRSHEQRCQVRKMCEAANNG